MADPPHEIADELYGAPFDEFIARRDAAAKELRREKRREEADAVKALRKPSLSAWGVNRLVREDRDTVDGLLAAGAALRQAKGGDALRDATRDEREAVAELTERTVALLCEAGHGVTDKTRSELRDTLHAAALDDDTRALIERGRLVEPRQALGFGGLGGFGAATAAPAPARAKRASKKAAAKEPAPEAEQDGRAARREAIAAARAALRDAEAAVRERERELRGADREVDERERELAEAGKALETAQRAADVARDALDEAREAVDRALVTLDEAAGSG